MGKFGFDNFSVTFTELDHNYYFPGLIVLWDI